MSAVINDTLCSVMAGSSAAATYNTSGSTTSLGIAGMLATPDGSRGTISFDGVNPATGSVIAVRQGVFATVLVAAN
jgi:hypothetical protein